jgi:hypothetical protein
MDPSCYTSDNARQKPFVATGSFARFLINNPDTQTEIMSAPGSNEVSFERIGVKHSSFSPLSSPNIFHSTESM